MTERIRILRIIARLNVGGPAIHVTLAAAGLDPDRYETRLLAGEVGEGEGDMSWYARDHGVSVETIPGLGREIQPIADIGVLRAIAKIVREWKPHIVHTHTAKAGTLGRLAAIAAKPRPKIVHTFHGHVLSGYFSKPKETIFRGIERALASRTDRLVVPSARLRDDLVAMRVGRGDQYAVIPLGFELEKFFAIGPAPLRTPRGSAGEEAGPRESGLFRAELKVPEGAILFGVVGRLTPIKNHALLLDAFSRMRSSPAAHLAIIGDGELRSALEADVRARGLADRVHFAGWRRDLAPIYRELDAVALSSINEGTPVAIIEAFASTRAVVSTAVGGVPDLVDSASGLLVPPNDAPALALALDRIATDPPLRTRLATAGRARADSFRAPRLLHDLDPLYRSIL